MADRGEDSKAVLERRAYRSVCSLDRNIGVTLDRTFVMRDESIGAEFRQESDNDNEITAHSTTTQAQTKPTSNSMTRTTFAGSIYLFRIIKIITGMTISCTAQQSLARRSTPMATDIAPTTNNRVTQ
jgi:hypothetical protein